MFFHHRGVANIQKIEFKSIQKGLEKSAEYERTQESPQPSQQKPRYFVIKPNNDYIQINQNAYQNSIEEDQEKKFDKLRPQPPSFFEKIPLNPLTLMNSTRKNKEIQIRILARSKQAVKKHNGDNSVQQSSAQDNAVREMLDTYKTQFTFKSALDSRKKRQVDDLKDKYFKTFFIKSQPQSKRLSQSHSLKLFIGDEYDSTKQVITKHTYTSEAKRRNITFQTWNIQENNLVNTNPNNNICNGYCTFVKELMKKNKRNPQSSGGACCYITQN